MALPNLTQISDALDQMMPELTPVPVGTVAYAHEVPTGWLQCNGAEVSRTTYARLFRKIGMKYGAGNGSTTFNLPDLQHRVLEGTNTTSEVAQKVEAGLPDISGCAMLIASFDDGTVAGVFDRTKNTPRANEMGEIGKANYSSLWFAASRSNGLHGKSETVQPAALRLLAIIKI